MLIMMMKDEAEDKELIANTSCTLGDSPYAVCVLLVGKMNSPSIVIWCNCASAAWKCLFKNPHRIQRFMFDELLDNEYSYYVVRVVKGLS